MSPPQKKKPAAAPDARPLRTFHLTAEVTISLSTVVQARSLKEAYALAEDRPLIGLCHQCASGTDTEEWVTSGELDGEPRNVRLADEGIDG